MKKTIVNELKQIFQRDLIALKTEIESYSNEANLWLVDKRISNSAGNLCLHLIGNLNAFVGAEFGNTGFVRQRDLEFSQKDVPRKQLLQMLDQTMETVLKSLDTLSDDQLADDFPKIVFKENKTNSFFLIHLTTHLAYHLGQINYHRRLLD